MSLRAKRVYDPPSKDEGTRVLVMRLWPRGIRKSRVDAWYRELGPSLPLLHAFRSGRVGWADYRRRYIAGLERPGARGELERLRRLVRRGRVTILCGCPDERRCHRGILRKLLGRALARS